MVSFMRHWTEPILNPGMQQKQAYNQIRKHRSKIPAGDLAPTKKLPLVGRIGLLFVLLLSLSVAHADFAVIGGNSVVERNRLRTDAELDLALDRTPAEALVAGIPLSLSVDIRLYRLKGPLWKKQIADWRYRHVLDYHRLSGALLRREFGIGSNENIHYPDRGAQLFVSDSHLGKAAYLYS